MGTLGCDSRYHITSACSGAGSFACTDRVVLRIRACMANMVIVTSPTIMRMICIHLIAVCTGISNRDGDVLGVQTHSAVACYVGIVPVVASEKARLVIASSHLPGAIQVGIHLTSHHESFGGASPLIISALGVVEYESYESHNRSSNCHDDNAQDIEATLVLDMSKICIFL